MEGLKKMIGKLSIRQSFVFFVVCFLILDIALCVGTSAFAIFTGVQNYSRFMGAAIIIYSTLCLILADILFYYMKLKKPIHLIKMSAERISNSDLDFTLRYDSMDEMGRLCSAIDYMRENLQENNRMMWRQMEERRNVNSVFAHDMRIPLTVLKGYLEIFELQPEDLDVTEIRQNALVMRKHIERMESYVEALNELQKVEDIRFCPQRTQWEGLKEQVRQSVEILCQKADKKLIFKTEPEYCDHRELLLDPDIVAQLVDNLISNAVRYAQSMVEVSLSLEGGQIRLVVKDDGRGFSQAALKNALIPFYSESENSTNRGLGLYISNLLCQIHNGSLSIANGEKGAIITVLLSENL